VKWFGLSKRDDWRAALDRRLPEPALWTDDPLQLPAMLAGETPAVLVVQKDPEWDAYELTRSLTEGDPLLFAVIAAEPERIDYKLAIEAGAADVLTDPDDAAGMEQLMLRLNRLAELKKRVARDGRLDAKGAKIVTVCSTKGGVGKTTMTVNLAAAFNRMKRKVLIVDLDLQFGDVSILLDIKPRFTIYDWVKESTASDRAIAANYVNVHQSGISVMSAPSKPELADLITGKHVERLLQEMRTRFDVILIDTPPSFVETSLQALEQSDDILLVTTAELPTLKNVRTGTETLQALELKERVKIILNREGGAEGLDPKTIEQILGTPVFARVVNDYKSVAPSHNEGVPFIFSAPSAPVSKNVLAIADALLPANGAEETQPVGWRHFFSRFKKGKKAASLKKGG